MLHVRYDQIVKTGVIQPFSISAEGPVQRAQGVVKDFQRAVGDLGPTGQTQPQPATIAREVERLAAAMKQGIKPAIGTDPRLVQAAKNLAAGKPVTIRSAGQAARIRAAAPASLTALRASSGMQAGMVIKPVPGGRPGQSVVVRDHRVPAAATRPSQVVPLKTAAARPAGRVLIRDHRAAARPPVRPARPGGIISSLAPRRTR